MKHRQYVIYFCLFWALLLTFIGCAGTSKGINADSDNQERIENPVGMDESFDPFSLGDYDLDVKRAQQDDKGELDFSFLAATEADTASLPSEAPGYRVQIFASTDQEEANAVRRDAILRFEGDVYIVFDNPYYKVRIGNCLSRFEADDLQSEAEKKGYLDAWVVRTKVTVKTAKKEQP